MGKIIKPLLTCLIRLIFRLISKGFTGLSVEVTFLAIATPWDCVANQQKTRAPKKPFPPNIAICTPNETLVDYSIYSF